MNHREIAKRVLRIATGTEPTEDQVDRLVDARKDGLRVRFVTVDWARSKTSSEEFCKSVVADQATKERPFKIGDLVECVDVQWTKRLTLGHRYTVAKVREDGDYVELIGAEFSPGEGWDFSRFRLVSRWEVPAKDPLPGFSRGIGGR